MKFVLLSFGKTQPYPVMDEVIDRAFSSCIDQYNTRIPENALMDILASGPSSIVKEYVFYDATTIADQLQFWKGTFFEHRSDLRRTWRADELICRYNIFVKKKRHAYSISEISNMSAYRQHYEFDLPGLQQGEWELKLSNEYFVSLGEYFKIMCNIIAVENRKSSAKQCAETDIRWADPVDQQIRATKNRVASFICNRNKHNFVLDLPSFILNLTILGNRPLPAENPNVLVL